MWLNASFLERATVRIHRVFQQACDAFSAGQREAIEPEDQSYSRIHAPAYSAAETRQTLENDSPGWRVRKPRPLLKALGAQV